jgi:hypothetical protein
LFERQMSSAAAQFGPPKQPKEKDPEHESATNVIRPGQYGWMVDAGIDLNTGIFVVEDRPREIRVCRSVKAYSSSGIAWLPGVIAMMAVLVIYSVQPVMRLSSSPPPEFLAVDTGANINEELFARAYWSCTRNLPYSYGIPLPADPPPPFSISEEHAVSRQDALTIRRLYWNQLQKTWLSPTVWQKTYTWRWSSRLAQLFDDLVSPARSW